MAWTPLDESIAASQPGHITDHEQSHRYLNVANAARGIQHVDSSYGNDSNSGSYGHPVTTIAQAVSNLTSGGGGAIYPAGGTYPVHDLSVTVPITVAGVGRGKTIVSTASTDSRGFWVKGSGVAANASRSLFTNFTMTGSTAASTATRLVDVDTADWVLLDNIDFRDVGYTRTDNPARSASPVAVYTSATEPYGTGTISDWLQLRNCVFYHCFRGATLTGAGNGYVTGCTWIAPVREHLYISGNSYHCNTGWMTAGSSMISGEYLLVVGGSALHTTIENYHFEIGAAAGGRHHIKIEDSVQRTIINDAVFRANDVTATYCVDISGTADRNIVGPYVETGNGVFRDTSSGANNKLWQPSDFTGTFT